MTEIKIKNIGRNDKCHCGSKIKYKKCCLDKDNSKQKIPSRNITYGRHPLNDDKR